MRYEYKVVPAPARGDKRGANGTEGRFASAVERLINELAGDGWEYQRAETLPSEERSGLTSTVTVWRNLMVFRRPAAEDVEAFEPKMLAAPLVLDAPVDTPPEDAPPAPALNGAEVTQETRTKAEDDEEDAPAPPIQALPNALMARAARLRKSD